MKTRKGEKQASHTHPETERTAVGGMLDRRVENHTAEWRKVVARRLEFEKATS